MTSKNAVLLTESFKIREKKFTLTCIGTYFLFIGYNLVLIGSFSCYSL